MSAPWSIIVPCCEVHNTQTESHDDKGAKCSVQLQCAYADRHLLAFELLSNRYAWPHYTLTQPPRAKTAGIKPLGDKGTVVGSAIVYEKAIVTVNYESNADEEEDEDGNDVYSESLEPTVNFLTLDHKNFRWGAADGDLLKENEAPGRQYHGLKLVRTLMNRSAIPGAVLSSVGKVHNASYTSPTLGLTWPSETLLYMPPQTDRTIRTDGTKGWNITLTFMHQEQGWNKFWRVKTETYVSLWDVKGGKIYKNYTPADLSSLLG